MHIEQLLIVQLAQGPFQSSLRNIVAENLQELC